MPCKSCRILFVITPCKHPTGIFTKDLMIPNTSTTWEVLPHYYPLLKEGCPCKECLINVICIDGRECTIRGDFNGKEVVFITPNKNS